MIYFLDQTDSTNNRLIEHIRQQQAEGKEVENLTTFYTDYQSAGRGQQGNSWESEAGQNLLFSTYMRVNLPPQEQFRVCELVSVAVAGVISDTLALYSHGQTPGEVKIKWPNDIYINDKKICGILIEHCLKGNSIESSVVGVGINVNQLEFHSPAPNPASLRHFTGKKIELRPLLDDILKRFADLLPILGEAQRLHDIYMATLYRRNGLYKYEERECSVRPVSIATSRAPGQFLAEIKDVDPQGRLVLQDTGSRMRTYHFKQIRFVIEREK